MAEIRIALNSTTPSGVGNNEIVLYPTNNNGGELNVVGPDGQPKRLLTDLTTLNNITVSGSLTKTGTDTIPNIGLPVATSTNDGAFSRFDKQLIDSATSDNTDNTIVKRDNAGSFLVNKITASLFEGPSTSTQLIPVLTGAITSDGQSNMTSLSSNLIDNSHIKAVAGISLNKLAQDPLSRTLHTGLQGYETISNFNEGIDNYLATNKIESADISSTAGITMQQLLIDPTNRTNHVGPHPASALENLDVEVNTIINTFLINNPIQNVQIANNTITASKLAFDPLDRSNHTGNIPVANITGFDDEVKNTITSGVGINITNGEVSVEGSELESVGVITTGVWRGTSIAVEYGGTGANTPGQAGHALAAVDTVTSDTTLTNDNTYVLCAPGAGTDITITLPNASNNQAAITIKKVDSSAQVIIVEGASGQNIDGATTFTLPEQYDTITVVSNKLGDWFIVSKILNTP